MARLTDEVCIVTGSTAGLGVAIARACVREGARVVVTGRNRKRGHAAAAEIDVSGDVCQFIRADLSDEAERQNLVDATSKLFGHPSVLVNNAVDPDAIAADGPVAATSVELWERMLAVNLIAVASLCRLVIPGMQAASRGSIVNVSSRAAERGTPGLAAYTASKAGLNALARSITMDYAREGIRCNTVQPGYILNAERDRDANAEQMARIREKHLTRLATADDVAHAVVFLASRESEVISGVLLPVDGGSTAVRGATLG